MELTHTCCFEFDRKRRAGGKRMFLHTFCFYFMVAGFTYWSFHPEVDKSQAAFPNACPTGAQLGPNLAQLGPNWGPYGMLLGMQKKGGGGGGSNNM